MVNVSIISKCNNNCKYCFQQDSYHDLNKMLSYSDIEDILRWSKGSSRIAYLGGEPTLHPDIVKILKRTVEEFQTVMFSNLLGPTKLMEQILTETPQVEWLVNTTTREELKDLFETNIKLFRKHKKTISTGITLMMDEEYDDRSIRNMIRLGREYPDVVNHYRLGLATPFHKNKVELLCYNDPVLKFCRLAKQETPDINIGFDCPTNMCQVTPKAMGEILEEYNVQSVHMVNHCSPVFDVMVDKSIKYCSSVPDDFIPVKSYKEFRNWLECEKFLYNFKNKYMERYGFHCLQEKECRNGVCSGICFATTEYMRRQKMEQENNC